MNRKLSEEDRSFIKDNWSTVSNLELANMFGVHPQSITRIARELKLKDKREGIRADSGNINENDLEKIEEYEPSSESKLEREAREKTQMLHNIKNVIKEKNSLKIKVKEERGSRILTGTVVRKTDNLVTLQVGNYKESFAYTEFFTGRAVIV